MAPESSVIEATGLVHVGSTPGACWGWECALCDSASGLAWGAAHEAARSLTLHLAVDCHPGGSQPPARIL